MSADRYEIFDDGPCIRIVSPDSTISTIVGRPVGYHIDDAVIGAIRQQARDIEQLRTDLAAAVAENAALLAANRDCILHFDAIKADYDVMKLHAEQAEARLAAIDNAPTVAVIHDSHGYLSVARAVTRLPDEGTELIAGPAEDSQSAFEETARSAGIRFDDIENHEDKP